MVPGKNPEVAWEGAASLPAVHVCILDWHGKSEVTCLPSPREDMAFTGVLHFKQGAEAGPLCTHLPRPPPQTLAFQGQRWCTEPRGVKKVWGLVMFIPI